MEGIRFKVVKKLVQEGIGVIYFLYRYKRIYLKSDER